MKKYKYDVGDFVMLKNNNFGKLGIIIEKPEVKDVVYKVLLCGVPEPVLFWEDEIKEKI